MKSLLIIAVVVIVALAVSMSGPNKVTDADLIATVEMYPELYEYSDWKINHRSEKVLKDHTEISFGYSYKQRAKTHIALIDGRYVAVDNAFVNGCVDYEQAFHDDLYECRFITEMGTVAYVKSDHTSVVVDHWGVLSRDNLQKALLSKETFGFLNGFVRLFSHNN